LRVFERWFGQEDPSRDWVAGPAVEFVLDLDESSLNGARLGDDIERLSALGPAEDHRAARFGALRYYSKGLSIELQGRQIASFLLVWQDPLGEGYLPYSGVCRARGAIVRLAPEVTEGELILALGPAYWRDSDEDELLLFYEHGDVEWQFELTADGRLKALLIVTPPLLADEEQRRAYGVTGPWPPSGARG